MQNMIVHQALCVLDVLEEMLTTIDEDDVNTGDKPRDVLGRQALHILGAFDAYSSTSFRWSARYGKSIGLFGKKCDPHEMPSKAELLKYLDEMKTQFSGHVTGLSAEHL